MDRAVGLGLYLPPREADVMANESTSTTNQNYRDYYGQSYKDYWDQHVAPAGGPP